MRWLRQTHENSVESYNALDVATFEQLVLQVYIDTGLGLTGRQVAVYLVGDYRRVSLVQPRISTILSLENSPLKEIGKTKCQYYRRRVRVVQFEA